METLDIFHDLLVALCPSGDFDSHFGTFCGRLVHFVVVWYILWLFDSFCGYLVHFVVIWYIL
jgi:hypothetical protein